MDITAVLEFFKWCTIINAALLIFSSLICVCAGGWIYGIHSRLFPIPREAFNIAIYSFLGLFKVLFIVFNLVPYIVLLIIG